MKLVPTLRHLPALVAPPELLQTNRAPGRGGAARVQEHGNLLYLFRWEAPVGRVLVTEAEVQVEENAGDDDDAHDEGVGYLHHEILFHVIHSERRKDEIHLYFSISQRLGRDLDHFGIWDCRVLLAIGSELSERERESLCWSFERLLVGLVSRSKGLYNMGFIHTKSNYSGLLKWAQWLCA